MSNLFKNLDVILCLAFWGLIFQDSLTEANLEKNHEYKGNFFNNLDKWNQKNNEIKDIRYRTCLSALWLFYVHWCALENQQSPNRDSLRKDYVL